MRRLLDILLALIALAILGIPLIVVALLVKLTSRGPALYWSDRVGKGNRIFRMPKFRTMRIGTPAVATHLLDDPERYLTPVGCVLRKTSCDELPQIFTVLKGEMSIVGPRPALYNQEDLIALRTEKGVHELTPGLRRIRRQGTCACHMKLVFTEHAWEDYQYWVKTERMQS